MRKLCFFVLIIFVAFVWIFPASAYNTDVEEKMNKINNQLDSINMQKQKNEQNRTILEKSRMDLLSTQEQNDREYEILANDLQTVNSELEKLEIAVKLSEDNYNKQMQVFKLRLRKMYENSYYSHLEVLMDSKNIIDLLERIELISVISSNDNDIIKSLAEAKNEVVYKKSVLETVKSEKQDKFTQKREAISIMVASRADLEDKIRKSKEELERLERQEDRLIEQSNELSGEIRNITSEKTEYAGGAMIWPVPSSTKIDSYFGMRLHPIYKKYKMHTGVDIDADQGASIIAVNKGKVILAGWKSGYGNTLIIDHGGGTTTLYAHCSKLLVKQGDLVETGQTIAKAGKTGLATGPHLHFEVRENGEVTNPLNYISP